MIDSDGNKLTQSFFASLLQVRPEAVNLLRVSHTRSAALTESEAEKWTIIIIVIISFSSS